MIPGTALDVDLHSHSRVSDGTLAPAALVRLAHERGVQLLALTDHDHLGGLAEAQREAARLGVEFVCGVEISVSWSHETVHVVGLRIDPACAALVDGLARTRAGRDERAREMGAALARAGIPGAYEGALAHVANPALVGRTHFARFLVEQGVCGDVREVFRRYLVEGKPGFVAHRWAALADVAAARGLLASRGTDFHGPGENRVEFGQLPALPSRLEPVWSGWPEAVRAARRAAVLGA